VLVRFQHGSLIFNHIPNCDWIASGEVQGSYVLSISKVLRNDGLTLVGTLSKYYTKVGKGDDARYRVDILKSKKTEDSYVTAHYPVWLDKKQFKALVKDDMALAFVEVRINVVLRNVEDSFLNNVSCYPAPFYYLLPTGTGKKGKSYEKFYTNDSWIRLIKEAKKPTEFIKNKPVKGKKSKKHMSV